jgi:tetraacyldisaccharide 4'-kinase
MKQSAVRWFEEHWYGERAPLALIPLSLLFRAAVALRRMAYRRGWKKSERLPVPVIVVGNLTVGGAGKTPMTIWLAQFLAGQGYKPGVISRGYGGARLRAPLAVYPDSDPRAAGDEPVLIARRAGGCPVYVFPRRVEAAKALLAATDCDIVVADDGLQHYALARDIEIVMVDGARRIGNGHCLPAGPLREPAARAAAADFVVCVGVPRDNEYGLTLEGREAVNLADPTMRRPLRDFLGVKLRALAGIGHPGRFFESLREAGLKFEAYAFPDHHAFRRDDIWFGDIAAVLMTEKDAVKCRRFVGEQHWCVPVRAVLPPAFGENLLKLLKAKRDGQKIA